MAWDFSTPEGRLAAIEALGSKRYGEEMAKWKQRQEIEPFIRVIHHHLYGRLFWIDELACGYSTIDQARHALMMASETGKI